MAVVSSFIKDNQTDIGIMLANLATTGQLLVRHINGVEEVLELYPALAAGSMTVEHPNGTGYLGFVLNVDDPPDCGTPDPGPAGLRRHAGAQSRPIRAHRRRTRPRTAPPRRPAARRPRLAECARAATRMYTGGGNQTYPSVVGTDAVRVGPTEPGRPGQPATRPGSAS